MCIFIERYMDIFMPVMPLSSAGMERGASGRSVSTRSSLQLFQALGRKKWPRGRYRDPWQSPSAPPPGLREAP